MPCDFWCGPLIVIFRNLHRKFEASFSLAMQTLFTLSLSFLRKMAIIHIYSLSFKTWLSVYLFGCLQMHLRTQKQNGSLLNDSTVLFRRCHERFFQQTFTFLSLFYWEFLFETSQAKIITRLPFACIMLLNLKTLNQYLAVSHCFPISVCSVLSGMEVLVKWKRVNSPRVFV